MLLQKPADEKSEAHVPREFQATVDVSPLYDDALLSHPCWKLDCDDELQALPSVFSQEGSSTFVSEEEEVEAPDACTRCGEQMTTSVANTLDPKGAVGHEFQFCSQDLSTQLLCKKDEDRAKCLTETLT